MYLKVFLIFSIPILIGTSLFAADPPVTPPKPKPTANSVVFIDPATGKIRKPDASEIGGLVSSSPTVGPKAPDTPLTLLQGPGGAVGAKVPDEALSYAIATIGPDGKLTTDCVTGDQAAAARMQAKTPAPKDSRNAKDPR
jgi:hypothetical protein